MSDLASRAMDPVGFPSPVDDLIKWDLDQGYTDKEVLHDLMSVGGIDKSVAGQRGWLLRIAALRRQAHHPEPRPTRPGAPAATNSEAVAAARQRLVEAGQPSSEQAIATQLGVSRGAVRWAEGKDRR
ncbi:MAG TPA: hypothetical protein VE011_09785 [Candidatus Dormibacteraeota bacterium]|nr:hypothetical protein [Candidatus Dormibacteraeota bacterium]